MTLAIILVVHFGLLVSEAYYDTIVHKAKSTTDENKRRKYTQWYHLYQLIIYFSIFSYGIYYSSLHYNLFSITTLFVAINYLCFRFWLFNPIYNYVNDLAGTYLSSNEFFDRILKKFIIYIIKRFSIKNIGIIIMLINIIKFILFFVSIIYLSKNL